jgi:RNA polymerase sigma factor (sigma-70 family)
MKNKTILLWDGIRSGNEKSLHELYVLHYDDLLRYGNYLTNDIELSKEYINLLFLDLWNNRLKLPEVKNPKAYIVTSYKNKIIFRKKRARDLRIVYLANNGNDHAETVSSYEDTLIEMQEYECLKEKLQKALSSLSERQQQLIMLRFIEELSYEEIASKLNISVRTVYNSIHESLKTLRSKMNKKEFSLFYFLMF